MGRLFPLLMLAYGGVAAQANAAGACTVRGGATTMPLVELYTSEGCSSCPPADRWLSQRFASGEANFLAFHVDYWDYIGWPDRFASATYSQRQRNRVGAAGGSTVYTPQVMVGEDVRANWHREVAWKRALAQARGLARAALTLELHRTAAGWRATIGAASRGKAVDGAQVWLARHIDGQVSTVRAGENRGRTLQHDRVVRQLWGPWPLGAEAVSKQVVLTDEDAAWGVAVFVQDTDRKRSYF
ncbi:MAG TPA: DUF1223 domain-containing protein [Lysobacter sp.]|jgi:hypothetical protein|nr:DUF1223 domain-containing protein [Lysobacter sp.]